MANDPVQQIAEAIVAAQKSLDDNSRQATEAIAYQEVAQSMAIAVQSGVTQLQSVFAVNVATTGRAFANALDGDGDAKDLDAVLKASQATVRDSINDLFAIAAEAMKVLEQFPGTSGTGKQ